MNANITSGLLSDNQITVVLLNMGGPKDIPGVEPFLRRIFNDRLIIRFPFAQSVFAELIIRKRLKAVEERYGLIGGGSPILESSLRQVEALKAELVRRGRALNVDLCFNYSSPLPEEVVPQLKASGRKFILPLSMYPHYSLATTGSSLFYLKKQVQQEYPEAVFLESSTYYLHAGYIQAFVDRVQETLKSGERLDDFHLVFSAHGTPQYFLNEGDPYAFEICQTVGRMLGALGRDRNWSLSYQSDVGPIKWIKPSTSEKLKQLAGEGVRKLIMIPVSFVNDHIETLCEIDIEYREEAEKLGIHDYRMAKAIESHPAFIGALADSVERSLKVKQMAAVSEISARHLSLKA